MMNSAACGTKTPRAGAGTPCCEKSSRHKGLMQGRGIRYRRTDETSRQVIVDIWERIPGQTAARLNWPISRRQTPRMLQTWMCRHCTHHTVRKR